MSPRTYATSLELQNWPVQTPLENAQSAAEPIPFHSDQDGISQNAAVSHQHVELPDQGPAAWRLLGAAFAFEALLWGGSSLLQSSERSGCI